MLNQQEENFHYGVHRTENLGLSKEAHYSYKQLLSLTHLHHSYSEEHIDLCPSNSWISAAARLCMGSNLSNTYHTGVRGPRLHSGVAYIDLIERDLKSKLQHLFGFSECCCQFLSGMQALTAVFASVLKKGDTVFSLPVVAGGHFSHQVVGPLKLFSIRLKAIPLYAKTIKIDYDKLEKNIKAYRPKLLILGSNQPLFSYDLKRISSAAKKANCLLLYDMSHVAGLIAQGMFQEGIAEYVDIVTSSTSKGFHAPDHGFVMYHNTKMTKNLQKALVPLLTANTHPQELASLAMVASEWIHFGSEFAKKMLDAAQFFAKALEERGFELAFSQEGFSQSHIIIIRSSNVEQALALLNQAGITASLAYLPDDKNKAHLSGIRLGLHSVVRRGFSNGALLQLADAFKAVLIDQTDPKWVHFSSLYDLANKHKECLFSFDKKLYEHRKETLLSGSSNQTHLLSLVASIPAFSSLPIKTLKMYQKEMVKCWYEKCTLIFKQNQVSDSVYFVLQGAIDIRHNHQGKETAIATVGVGGHVGEVGVLGNQVRLYNAYAKEKTLCLLLPKDAFLELICKHDFLRDYFTQYIVDMAQNMQDLT